MKPTAAPATEVVAPQATTAHSVPLPGTRDAAIPYRSEGGVPASPALTRR